MGEIMNDANDDGGLLMPEPGPEPKKNPRPTKVASAAEPKIEAPRAVDEDLSAEIARSVPREPGDQVTCRRITKNHYRCNWWRNQGLVGYDNPGMSGLLVTTSRISKSQFLRVTPAESGQTATGRLSITVVPER
jgi:hypothetical protein